MAPTDKQFRRPAMWRHPRLVWRRILKSWPLLIWVLAVVAVMVLYRGSGRLSSLMGAVETLIEPIAPLETARLLTVPVILGQRVKAGDVMATMDTLLFDAETAVADAQLIEVEGTLQNYQQRILEFVHRFEEARSQAQFDLETENLNQRRDAAVLGLLRAELNRMEDLKSKGLISEQDLSQLRPEIASLEQTVAAYPELVAIHARRLAGATEDEATMRQMLMEGQPDSNFDILSSLRKLRKATDAIVKTTHEQRDILRASYSLRAQRDGVVSEIFHQPGDVVPAGEPIVRLVAEHPQRVIGFLPEVHVGDVAAGDDVWIWRQRPDSRRIRGKVESIAPEIDPLPGRVAPLQGTTLRGRRIVLTCDASTDLIPGETVRIETTSLTLALWLERMLSPQ